MGQSVSTLKYLVHHVKYTLWIYPFSINVNSILRECNLKKTIYDISDIKAGIADMNQLFQEC